MNEQNTKELILDEIFGIAESIKMVPVFGRRIEEGFVVDFYGEFDFFVPSLVSSELFETEIRSISKVFTNKENKLKEELYITQRVVSVEFTYTPTAVELLENLDTDIDVWVEIFGNTDLPNFVLLKRLAAINSLILAGILNSNVFDKTQWLFPDVTFGADTSASHLAEMSRLAYAGSDSYKVYITDDKLIVG